jgi:hypothetical protein
MRHDERDRPTIQLRLTPPRFMKMDRGRLAVALVCAVIVLTIIVWAVLAVLAAKLFL